MKKITLPGFQSELSRKQVKKYPDCCPCLRGYWKFQSELSRKQVKKCWTMSPAASTIFCFNPSYPGSRSRSARSHATNRSIGHVSIRVIPEAGQEVGVAPCPGYRFAQVSIRVIPEAGQEAQAIEVVNGYTPRFQSELSRKQVKKSVS